MCWSWTLPIYLFDLNHGSHRENKVQYTTLVRTVKTKKRHFTFPLNKLFSTRQGKNVLNITAWTRLRCWMHSVGASLLCFPFCIKRHLNCVNSKDCSENRIINSVPAYVFVIDPFYSVSTPQWMPKKICENLHKVRGCFRYIFQDHRWAPVSILFWWSKSPL
jgi:hypothetical protein